MLAFLKYVPLACLLGPAKDMLMLAGLRAAIAVLALIGKQLSLNDNERRAILARIETSLLGEAAA